MPELRFSVKCSDAAIRGEPCEHTLCGRQNSGAFTRFIPGNLLELRDIIIFTSSTAMAQCRAIVLNPAVTCSKKSHVIFQLPDYRRELMEGCWQ